MTIASVAVSNNCWCGIFVLSSIATNENATAPLNPPYACNGGSHAVCLSNTVNIIQFYI